MKVRYTVPSAVTRAAYAGNGVTTVFSAPFNFFDNTDLDVILVNDTTAVETVQVLTTNYTVTGGDGSTGSVTMLVAPPTGNTLVIERDIPFTQEIDLEPNDPFPAEVTEEGFDRSTMLAQQNRLEIQKSPKLPPTYDPDSDPEIRIPVPSNGKVLVGNAAGTGWDNTAFTDISTADIPAIITSVANRDLLEYDSGTPAWRNQTRATVLGRTLTTTGDLMANIAGAVNRLPVGANGQYLSVAAGALAWASFSNIVIGLQVFTAGGTYTPTAGMKSGVAIGVGGGGGGGGIQGDVGWTSEAAGGGAGGQTWKLFTAADIGASKAVVIGALGAGGAAGANNGAAGGDTTLGTTILVAKGGAGGQYTDAGVQLGVGGLGGVAGTGTFTPGAEPGGSGFFVNSTFAVASGANGGSSIFGGGGRGGIRTAAGATAGDAGVGYGAGGGGAAALDSAATAAGGNATAGVLIIIEFG